MAEFLDPSYYFLYFFISLGFGLVGFSIIKMLPSPTEKEKILGAILGFIWGVIYVVSTDGLRGYIDFPETNFPFFQTLISIIMFGVLGGLEGHEDIGGWFGIVAGSLLGIGVGFVFWFVLIFIVGYNG